MSDILQLSKERKAAQAGQNQGIHYAAGAGDTAYQKNLSQPEPAQSQPWNARRVLGNIQKISAYDPEKAQKMYSDFRYLQSDPTSKYYNPYAQATNRSVQNLAAYGIDTSVIDDKFFEDNDYLRQHLIYDGTTNTPTKPGKKATDLQKAAYEYYQIYKSEDATKKAETQWKALQEELSYWAWQPDRNYSDEEIISRIDWDKYKELVSMDDSKGFQPNEYNRSIGYSQDAIYGVLWMARNPGFKGSIEDAMAFSALGAGNSWQENKEISAKLDAGNAETYDPYSVGSTMEQEMVYFGMSGFNQEWIDEHRNEVMGGNDETAKKYYANIVEAEKYTQKLENELTELYNDINGYLQFLSDPDDIIAAIKDTGDFKDLFALDDTLDSGKLKSTTRAVNYRWKDVEKQIREACEKAAEVRSTTDLVSWVEGNPEASEADKALAEYYKKNVEQAIATIKETGTGVEITVAQTGKAEDFDGAQQTITNTPVTPSKAAQDAVKLAVDEAFELNRTIYSFEQHQSARQQAQAELDRLTPEWAALKERKDVMTAMSGMTASEYQGFKELKELTGDPEWDYYKRYLELGRDKMGDEAMQEKYNNALYYLYKHVRPGDYTTDTETIQARAEEWWKMMQSMQPKSESVQDIIDRINRQGNYEDSDLELDGGRYSMNIEQNDDDSYYVDSIRDNATGQVYGPEEIAEVEQAIAGRETQWLTPEEAERYEMLSERRNELQQQVETEDSYLEVNEGIYNDAKSDYDFLLQAYSAAAAASNGEIDASLLPSISYGFKVGQEYVPTPWTSSTVYDMAIENGELTKEEAITDASASTVLAVGEAKMLTDLVANLDKYGVSLSDGERKNIQRRIDYLQREAKSSAYYAIDGAEDYEEKVQKGREMALSGVNNYILNGVDAGIVKVVTGVTGASGADEFSSVDAMTEDEKNRFLYLLAADGEAAAKDYFKMLTDPDYGMITIRKSENLRDKVREFASKDLFNATLATAFSFATNIVGGPTALFYEVSQWAQGKEVNPGSAAFQGQIFTESARQGSREALHKTLGDGALVDLVYDAFTSSVDSMINAKITENILGAASEVFDRTRLGKFITNISDAKKITENGVNVTDKSAASVIGKWLGGGSFSGKVGNFVVKAAGDLTHASTMGLNAASAAYRQAIVRGATHEQALGMFMATFWAETGSEAITFSNLHDSFVLGGDEAKRSLGDFVKAYFKNGAEEFFGEGINEWIEQNADRVIMGAMSEYEQTVKYYTDLGYPSSVAKQIADKELWSGILRAGATGFISSNMGTSVEYGMGYMNDRIEAQRNQKPKAVPEISSETGAVSESLLRDRYKAKGSTEQDVVTAPTVNTPVTDNSVEIDAQQFTKDSNTLIGVHGSDATAAAIGVASVLGTGVTDARSAKAAAQTMVGTMAGGRPRVAARAMQGLLTAFRGLQQTEDYQNASLDWFKNMLTMAALTDGEGHAALQTVFNKAQRGGEITAQNVMNVLNGVLNDSSDNPVGFEQTYLNTVRENRVANYTIRNMANFRTQMQTADAAVQQAQTNLANAQQAANEANATVEAVSENLQAAKEAYMPENGPIATENAGTFEQTRNELVGAIAAAEEAENKVTIQQQQVEEARKKRTQARRDAMAQARAQAEVDVAQEDTADEQTLQEQQAAYPATRALRQAQPARMANGQQTQITGVYAVVGPDGQNVGMQGYYENDRRAPAQRSRDGFSVYSTPQGYITTNDLDTRDAGIPRPVQQAENGWYERSARNPIEPAFWFNHSLQGTDTVTGQTVTLMGVAGVNGSDDVLIDSNGGTHVFDDIQFAPDPFTGIDGEQSYFDMTGDMVYDNLPEVQVERPQRGAETVDIGRTETPGEGNAVPAEIPGDNAGQLPVEAGRNVRSGDNIDAGPDGGESIHGRGQEGLSERVRPDKGRVSERLLSQQTRNKLKAKGVTSTALHEETDPQRFSSSLDAARATNPYRLFVDPQSPADLEEKGAIMLSSADGKIVGAVGTKGIYEGDIFAVCKDPSSRARNASRSIIIHAIAQGGTKLDCYNGTERNPGLPGMYSSVGMIPVARVAFADALADPSWNYERDGRPDVIFWMLKPGETAESIIQKYGKPESEGGFHKHTMEELAELPLFEDTVNEKGEVTEYGYDKAWAYRDAKLANDTAAADANGDIQALNLGGGTRKVTPTQKQAEKVKGELQSPQKIAMRLAKALNFGNYIGSNNFGSLPASVQGYWSRHAQLLAVRNKDIGNYTVTFHELGHGLAQLLKLTGTDAMVTNMLDDNPEFLLHYSESQLRDEAMAEFMWRWMEDRNRAVEFAGEAFVNNFEKQLAGRPAVNQVVKEAREQFQQYIEADTNAKVAARVAYENDPRTSGFRDVVKTLINEIADSTSVASDVDLKANTDGKLRRQALFANHAQKRTVMNLTSTLTDANGTILGDGLAKMLQDAGLDASNEEVLHAFERYCLLLHSMNRDTQNKPVFGEELTPEVRQAEIDRLNKEHPEFERAEKAWQTFRHNFLTAWMVDTGYWTADFLQHLEEMYPHYVPTYRVRGNDTAIGGTGFGRSAKRYTLKAATGGSEDIYSPMYSFIGMVDQITSMVATNQIAQVFDQIYQENEGMGVFGRQIPGPAEKPALKPTGEQNAWQKQLSEVLNGKVDADIMQEVLDITKSQPGVKQPGQNSARTLRVQRQNGEVVQYEIDNPELYKLLTGAQGSSGIRALQAVGKLTRTMSMLTTGSNPLFALRNAVRDYQNSINYGTWASNYLSGIPKWIKAFAQVARNSEAFQEYQALGGGGWQRIQQNNAQSMKEIRSEMFGDDRSTLGKTAKWAGKKLWNTITMERLNEIIEQTSRFVEYQSKAYNRSTVEGRQQAFQAAQDVTVDFSRSGNSELAYVLKKVVPFFNASMQGVYRTGRQLTQAERSRVGTRLTKTIVNTALMSALAAGLIKRYGSDEDKEEFMMLSSGVKANHLVLPNPVKGEGQPPFLRIPLAQDPLGYAVHSLVTNAMMNGSDDEMAITLAATADVILDNLNPLGSGTIAQPFIDVSHNRTWYGSNLVRTMQTDWADRGSQYNEDTPELFKTMGRMLNASPEVIEYLAQQYTGFIGAMAIPALSVNKDGSIGGFDALMNSVVKKWTTDPASSNDVTSNFYDMKSVLTTIQGEAKADRPQGLLLRSLSQEDVNDAYEQADKMLKSGGLVYETSKIINDTYKEIDKINANDTLTDAQKALQTRQLRLSMLEQVEVANEQLQAFYKKYVQGETLTDQVFGYVRKGFESGKYAHVKSDIEKMPDVFQMDTDSEYMQRSLSVYENPDSLGYQKASALPHPSRTFTITDRYGNEDEYEIDDNEWPTYTEIYQQAYEQYLIRKGAKWNAMTDKEQFNLLKAAHSEANKAMKKAYATSRGIRMK